MAKARKYIFVVGGVMSGVGKGIATSAIGTILKARGYKVTAIKIDPYINVDAGTMNPTEHGEVFVLEDGDETDQDMGNYERFLNTTLPSINYMTTGRVYQEVIRKERNLEYKGKNVEVVPDIPFEVIRRIETAAEEADADVTLIEVGGTIGEYQNILFLEAGRMMKQKHPHDVVFVMVSYLPTPGHVGEMKTKPTQYAARSLNSAGIQADIILARSEGPLDQKRKDKLALFCNIPPENVISAPDVESIYDVPLNFERDNLGQTLVNTLELPNGGKTDLSEWQNFVSKTKNATGRVRIAIVGKYFNSGDFVLSDVYISVIEAIKFSSYWQDAKPQIDYLSSVDFETGKKSLYELQQYDGVIVPGGFGSTGVEGKIKVIEYLRKEKIPFLGICYGMHMALIEFARNVLDMKGAHTTEVDPNTKYPVIDIMPEQKKHMAEGKYGGTMRLGKYQADLGKGTIVESLYGKGSVIERHRHRYEVNPEYVEKFEKEGVVFSGKSPDRVLMEIMELPKDVHPFYVACQFHPELTAKPLKPHPLFNGLIAAALSRKKVRPEVE